MLNATPEFVMEFVTFLTRNFNGGHRETLD